ncbi:hypothetical protein PGQ11_012074 [Apiospora arundinis]|uniref:Uncharacterized protein n=1 Tax=Apiospora arundinis TaxID=335852 RepID=A0ABR2I1A5_9PEZI
MPNSMTRLLNRRSSRRQRGPQRNNFVVNSNAIVTAASTAALTTTTTAAQVVVKRVLGRRRVLGLPSLGRIEILRAQSSRRLLLLLLVFIDGVMVLGDHVGGIPPGSRAGEEVLGRGRFVPGKGPVHGSGSPFGGRLEYLAVFGEEAPAPMPLVEDLFLPAGAGGTGRDLAGCAGCAWAAVVADGRLWPVPHPDRPLVLPKSLGASCPWTLVAPWMCAACSSLSFQRAMATGAPARAWTLLEVNEATCGVAVKRLDDGRWLVDFGVREPRHVHPLEELAALRVIVVIRETDVLLFLLSLFHFGLFGVINVGVVDVGLGRSCHGDGHAIELKGRLAVPLGAERRLRDFFATAAAVLVLVVAAAEPLRGVGHLDLAVAEAAVVLGRAVEGTGPLVVVVAEAFGPLLHVALGEVTVITQRLARRRGLGAGAAEGP